MFSIDYIEENGFKKIRLTDSTGNFFAEIIPGCAAMLYNFSIVIDDHSHNVISSYNSKKEFDEQVAQKGFRGVKLSPFVCRIDKGKYRFGEKEYIIEKFYHDENALHGELFDKPFKVVNETSNEEFASVTMTYSYKQEDPGFPFFYKCQVEWKLSANGHLTAITTCTNKDKGLIPMQDGWHPYFDLCAPIDELYLEFQSKEIVVFNDKLIPTGEMKEYDKFNSIKKLGDTVYDNCFTLNMDTCQPMCVLKNKETGIQVSFIPAASYPYIQFYTPEDRKSIAIENISGAPDAFNNNMGFQTLEPGQSAQYEITYQLSLLK